MRQRMTFYNDKRISSPRRYNNLKIHIRNIKVSNYMMKLNDNRQLYNSTRELLLSIMDRPTR